MHDEVYGTTPQRAMLRRGRAMFDVLCEDPRFGYYGRGVGLISDRDAPLATAFRLAQLQGASNIAHTAAADLPALKAEAEAAGYSTTIYRRWLGGGEAFEAARAIVAETSLPDGLEIVAVDAQSPPALLEAIAEAAGSVGVMTLAGDVMRGLARQAVVLAACDGTGRVLSCAAASGYAHPDHPVFGDEAWWGMLATRKEARGARLSLLLGARVLQEMQARHGTLRVFTGVQDGNAASEAVCRLTGLASSDTFVLTLVDPAAMPDGKLTR